MNPFAAFERDTFLSLTRPMPLGGIGGSIGISKILSLSTLFFVNSFTVKFSPKFILVKSISKSLLPS